MVVMDMSGTLSYEFPWESLDTPFSSVNINDSELHRVDSCPNRQQPATSLPSCDLRRLSIILPVSYSARLVLLSTQ